MDKLEEGIIAVKALNNYHRGEIPDFELIKLVCSYFDKIKKVEKTNADLQFLKYISNIVGIPHYYDLLNSFNDVPLDLEEYNLNTAASIIYESSLFVNDEVKIHKFQKNVLDLFKSNGLNRYFLSASTSFGKTFLVYEIIRKMNYKNIFLIFPTIALLTENLEKIYSDNNYSFFKDNYTVHTLSEVSDIGERNLFIFTPERFLSFIDKGKNTLKYDFAFVDEVYKIDNDYIIDEITKENERDVAYRIALFYILKWKSDILLAGPYIEFGNEASSSINKFLNENEFKLINFNNYEIVNKQYYNIKSSSVVPIDDDFIFEFRSNSKIKRLITIISTITKANENCIVYCKGKTSAETHAIKVIESGIMKDHETSNYDYFIEHLSIRFRKNWVLVRALRNGIGIHHGSIPKYIQKEIIRLFNAGLLRVLFSTTTITEGVNTSAKNLIVYDNKKGRKNLKKFDAQNISGRAGRFLKHFSGRVIILKNGFLETIESNSEIIKHKNYDINSLKDEIDLFYTSDEYLVPSDKDKRNAIMLEQEIRKIPEEIFQQFKVISRMDKILVYDKIVELDPVDIAQLNLLISTINYRNNINWEGFEVLLKIIRPIVRNNTLANLIDYKTPTKRKELFSNLTYLLNYYLQGGFMGSVNYKLQRGDDINVAVRSTAEFVYNTLKYQAVKYFGVFNLMYKFFISQKNNLKVDEVTGIDNLLVKLEYNAITDKGRVASDYGVPFNIVDYYENIDNAKKIQSDFDEYEKEVFEKIEKIINK